MMQKPIAGGLRSDYPRRRSGRRPLAARMAERTHGVMNHRHHRLANFGNEFTNNFYDERLASVDSHEAGNSPYGLHHMAGNVWEWTADWYDETYYAKQSGT